MADPTIGQLEAIARGKHYAEATRELKFHPSASHILPDYRDGWNDAIETVAKLMEQSGIEEGSAATDGVGAGDSYDAIWNALQRIDAAAAMLPTYAVKHEGGIEAFTQNIVDAITALGVQAGSPAADPKGLKTLDEFLARLPQRPLLCRLLAALKEFDAGARNHGMTWQRPFIAKLEAALGVSASDHQSKR